VLAWVHLIYGRRRASVPTRCPAATLAGFSDRPRGDARRAGALRPRGEQEEHAVQERRRDQRQQDAAKVQLAESSWMPPEMNETVPSVLTLIL
jgi:hypothetical protein